MPMVAKVCHIPIKGDSNRFNESTHEYIYIYIYIYVYIHIYYYFFQAFTKARPDVEPVGPDELKQSITGYVQKKDLVVVVVVPAVVDVVVVVVVVVVACAMVVVVVIVVPGLVFGTLHKVGFEG